MRLRMVLLGVLGAVVLAVAGLGVALATLDFGRFAGPVAAQVERVTGRALAFEGEVSLRLWPHPSLSLRDVALANAPGGSRPQMLRIGRLEAELELWPLLMQRQLHITRLVARDADLLLERDAEGRGNWVLGAGAPAPAEAPAAGGGAVVRSGRGGLPLVDTMELQNVAVGWRDARAGGEARSLLVREMRLSSRGGERVAIAGAVVHREQVVGFSGEVDLPRGPGWGGAVVANASVTLPGAVVKLAGGMADAGTGRGLDLSITGEAEPISALEELVGVDLPALRLELAARVQGDLDGALRAAELKLKLGGSDLSGTGTLDLSGARPKVVAELEAARLDLVEAWPAAPVPASVPAKGEAGAPAVAERRVFSGEAFALEGLGALDADVGLRVGRLVLPAGKGLEVEQVVLRLVLADRDLALRPFGFVLAGSHVAGDARVNARAVPVAMVLDVAAQQADVGRLLALAGVGLPVAAKGDLVLALRGAGASPRALAGALDGNASLVVGHGTLKGDLIESLGLGAVRQAVPQLQRLSESRLNCAIARFDVARGVATARLIAADAGDLSLVGTGTVNLGTEALALDLAPRLKLAVGGISGGVSVPVQVRGTLLEPVVSVVGGRPGARGNPLAGLGRIVLDPGASAVNPCGGLGEARPAVPAPVSPGLPDVLRLLPR